MSLLDTVPHTLFRMLCSPARIRNVAVLEQIFAQFFDDFSAAPKKVEVLQVIRDVISDPAYGSLADEDDSWTGDTKEYLIFNKLRDDGWIMEVKNRRLTEVHMPREAHALLSVLVGLSEELKIDISAEASLIDSGILAAYDAPAEKVMNIASARRQAIQLRRSIDGVLTSLYRIEEDLMQSENLTDLLQRFMESFVDKLLLENYRTLKASSYNPMRFQRSIIDNTERFINDHGQIARAAAALADQGLTQDISSATTQILGDLVRIRDVFANLGEKLDLIDRFSHRLERRIATTVRYQETARDVREEILREAIRGAFACLDAGAATCISPFPGIPVPFSTATLALPRKARDPIEPQVRKQNAVDPIDLKREELMDQYVARMAVTPLAIITRLQEFAKSEEYTDLDDFQPADAHDIAILFEARARNLESLPGLEFQRMNSMGSGKYVSGPKIFVRRKEDER
ncbi:Wadjet anti-phage system protein JetA family protein [Tepidicaulis sp. LMO-SS28]|uniref:Wadjet anti-phage system protein JetA family protein n=1 Tax=Tepidicaulis sp. LMO-SS28 TaxID=3447455 RepID=UPI003EE02E3E